MKQTKFKVQFLLLLLADGFLRNMVLKMIKKYGAEFGRLFFHLQQGIRIRSRYSFIILYVLVCSGMFGGLLFEQIKINNISLSFGDSVFMLQPQSK